MRRSGKNGSLLHESAAVVRNGTDLRRACRPAGRWICAQDRKIARLRRRGLASPSFPAAEQKRLLERVEKLQAAVKRAREAANLVEAPNKEVGAKLFGWLFK